jgi:hypothetical protein
LANTIGGNLIGADATGSGALPNGSGVVGSVANNAPAQIVSGNVISGNTGDGVVINGPAIIQGNLIGTALDGASAMPNGSSGVWGFAGSTIGGSGAGQANVIANNGAYGVGVSGNGNAIIANSIYANASGGILLFSGANNNQAAPVLTRVTTDGVSTTVKGTVASTPVTTVQIEVFSNDACGPPTGFGQGKTLLSAFSVSTDTSGNATFSQSFGGAISFGTPITATATDSANNTSMFSACANIDSDGDGCPDARELGSDWHAGGQRDPNNGNDFFDVPVPALLPVNATGTRNKVIALNDLIAIVTYIGTSAANPNTANPNGAKYGTDLNNNGVPDGQEYDRSPSTTSGQPWRSNAGNGAVSLQDALVALNQVGTDCR